MGGVDVPVATPRENRTRFAVAGLRPLMLFGSVARGDDRVDVV